MIIRTQMRDSAAEEAEELSEDAAQREDGDGQKHFFQVTRVDEPTAAKEEEVDLVATGADGAGEKEVPRLDKVDSYMSDSGNSTLSYNQDTIGPLDNPSFLRNLNYSVSQAAVNEAGDEYDLDLDDFAGVKADVDGGWAWVILFAAVCSLSLTGATAFSAGVFMPHILEQIEPDISMASWIGAVHTSVSCFSGEWRLSPLTVTHSAFWTRHDTSEHNQSLLSGPSVSFWVNRIGARWTAFLAGLVIVAGFVGSYFATSFLHLILAHGLLAGIGTGYILNIMFVVTGQYFNRYRGFACGLLATGAGAGILAVGSVLTFLLENFGLNGAYLLWAGICSHILVFAMLLRPSNEEMLRTVEKRISAEQIKMNNANSGLNSLASGLNSAYSNGDVYSAYSGRTSDSRKLYRHPSKRSSRGELALNPLLRNVLNNDVSDSRNSVNTNRSHRSSRSAAALSNGNLSLAQNARLLDKTLLTADGNSLTVPGIEGRNSPLLSRASNYTISPLAAPDGSGEQVPHSPSDKTSSSSPCPTSPTNHIHSSFSLANEIIPEHEVVSKTNLEPPPSPTFSRSALSDFRKRLHSSGSHENSHHTSYSQISHLVSMRGPMRNGDLDNESLTSTLVSNLRPKDILEPRFRLGSRSIPTLFGSVASFPTSLAIVKDDLSRIEAVGQPIEKTLRDHLIGLLDSLRLLRNFPFMLFTAACLLWALGEAPFFLYLPAYAISQGASPSQAPSLYTAIGFGSMCGRFLSGLVASDKMIGPLLIHIGCLGLSGMVMTLTPVVASAWTDQVLCAGLFGLYTGSLVPLLSLITIELLGISELGMGFGLLCMIQGVAYLAGPPLAGALVKAMGFKICFIIFGILMTLGSLVGMLIAVLLGHEVGGEEDEHGSLDDLERALRRVSNCMSSGSEEDENQPGSPDATSEISRQTSGQAKLESGADKEDVSDSCQETNPPKDEGLGNGDGPTLSSTWPEEQGELETIDEEVENAVK
ncbi:monocarboxylate transporter 12 [Elysia marginata]|uniref:Monocarboxylate transporter 12 n=1 Tax=Elysia marginata TaxID=1093978 RepID=A0AAV4IC52_9GAST|nr:monocarboxylate transporter 12 [Elysia marginata]